MNIPTENQARGIRKYLFEYALIALSGCVVYLFYMYHSMNVYVNEKFMQNQIELRVIIEKNTMVIKQFIKEKD